MILLLTCKKVNNVASLENLMRQLFSLVPLQLSVYIIYNRGNKHPCGDPDTDEEILFNA